MEQNNIKKLFEKDGYTIINHDDGSVDSIDINKISPKEDGNKKSGVDGGRFI